MGVVLAFAGGGAQSGGSQGEKTVLKFWSHQQVVWNSQNEELIAAFEKENPNIRIEYEAYPYSDFEQKTQTALVSKSGGADIFELWGGWIVDISPTGAIAPVPDAFINTLKQDSYDMVLGGFEYNGKYYGVPIELNQEGGGLLVNKAYFDQHNIKYPSTWDEMTDIAKTHAVSRNGIFSMRGFDFVQATNFSMLYMSMILSQGGQYFVPGRVDRYNFDTPESIKALQTLADLITKDSVTNIDVFTGASQNDPFHWLFNGEGLMVPTGFWTIPVGEETYGVTYGKDFDYIQIPFFGPQKKWVAETGWGYVVNANTKDQEAAWKFVEFCVRPENLLKIVTVRGLVPPRKSVARDPAYLTAIPYAKPIIDIIDGVNYMGRINTSALKRILNNALVDMVQNGTPAAAAVKKINADLEPYYK
jgi:multiple sugar transport system substrate-binding protein